MDIEPLHPVAAQLALEVLSAEDWLASYQPDGLLSLESAEERGRRDGYLDGLRRAVDVITAATRDNVIYPPSA